MTIFTHYTTTINKIQKGWWTFHVQDDKEVLYIGCSRMSDIINLRNISCHEYFDKDKEYTIVVHEYYETRSQGFNALSVLIREMTGGKLPPFNLKREVSSRGLPVICNETGVVYSHAAEACNILHIQPPRMSAHLNRKPGNAKIYGCTFSYVKKDK